MEALFIVALVAVTSLAAYRVGTRRLALAGSTLRLAALRVVEGFGLTLLFLAANLGLGMAVVLGGRALTGWFVSIYLLDDGTWVTFSLLQALAFQWWRASSPSPEDGDAGR
jgi:hypothetical protein